MNIKVHTQGPGFLTDLPPGGSPCHGCILSDCWKCSCTGELMDDPTIGFFTGFISPENSIERYLYPGTFPGIKKRKEKSVKKRGFYAIYGDRAKRIRLPSERFGSIHNILLAAPDDSMAGAGIHRSDFLIFNDSVKPGEGDVVIADINGKVQCRRYLGTHPPFATFRKEDGREPQDTVTDNYIIYAVCVWRMLRCRETAS